MDIKSDFLPDSLFLQAAFKGDIDKMRTFVRRGDNVNQIFLIKKGGLEFKMTPLCLVLSVVPTPQNIEEVVKELLLMGADASFNDESHNPEFFAMANKHFKIVEMLRNHLSAVEKGEKFDKIDLNEGFTEIGDEISEEMSNFVDENIIDFVDIKSKLDETPIKIVKKRICFFNFLHGVVTVH